MQFLENISLSSYTTFKIGGPARFFCEIKNEGELLEAIIFSKKNNLKIFVLGGGSNVLISDKGFDGLVIKNLILGKESLSPNEITVGAGENWDDFVDYTLKSNLYGLENLSAIPGTVGAAPIQNIGAYGKEVASFIRSVRVLDIETLTFKELSNNECEFSYRHSFFKKNKGRYVITKVTFTLKTDSVVDISYKDLLEYFKNKSMVVNPSPLQVREAVVEIRKGKLPDLGLYGTAGSFFKNPIIQKAAFDNLVSQYPGLPGFPDVPNMVKVSLAWIVDKVCQAKGICLGKACIYEKQAIVLVAEPGCGFQDVYNLSQKIIGEVRSKTAIDIEPEVEILN